MLCSPQRSPLLRGTGPGTADTPILAQSQTASKMLRLARERLADFLFPKWMGQRASGLRHIHAHTHREGKEQYNLKTACKSVKQISMAWISQIIEPQSITNIKCIWPWKGAQLKNTNGNLLGTWKLRNISKGNLLGRACTPHHVLGTSTATGPSAGGH